MSERFLAISQVFPCASDRVRHRTSLFMACRIRVNTKVDAEGEARLFLNVLMCLPSFHPTSFYSPDFTSLHFTWLSLSRLASTLSLHPFNRLYFLPLFLFVRAISLIFTIRICFSLKYQFFFMFGKWIVTAIIVREF